MIDREKVVDALRNCINKPKCMDCPWEECENIDHETVELPKGLVMDIYDLLKAQKPYYKAKVPVQSLIDHIKTAIDVDPWAKEMAEELLKRDIPRKPKVDIDVYRCPVCAQRVMEQKMIGDNMIAEDSFLFCPNCGQAVKWE